jgi:phosphomannomutase
VTSALHDIVKAYDVRGLVATQLTPETAYALGVAAVQELGLVGKPFVVGHDMRPSSPELARALEAGATEAGATAMPIGLCSTDMVYFASGHFDAAAAMITASHNPAEYNGIKFAKAGAKGVSLNTGLAGIRDRAIAYLEANPRPTIPTEPPSGTDVLGDYVSYLRGLVDLEHIRPLKVVVDAANGMGGYTVPAVWGDTAGFAALPLDVVEMYFELDGTFPNHEANPLEPKNLVDLQRAVVEHGADLGIAFDGDADRCFVVDERGEPVSPSVVGSLVAKREVRRVRQQLDESKPVVLHNLICSMVVKETIESEGAIPIRTPVGHSLIKDEMARTNAVFGAEHSAHYYFRDFYGADSGMLAAMHVLAELGQSDTPLSTIAADYSPYVQSGEINTRVGDPQLVVQTVADAFATKGSIDRLDGLSVQGPESGEDMWWFNVRASNTEPLLRLNVEAATMTQLEKLTAEVLALINQGA